MTSQNTKGAFGIVKDARKRMRSFDDSLMILVCTPTVEQGPIWQEYLDSSQGVYHLRCQNCGELSIATNTLKHFQFECVLNDDDSKTYTEGSARIVCPACSHEHSSSDRERLIDQGGYIHKFPEKRSTKPGFQAGVLASKLSVFDWDQLAKIQLQCGRSADLKDRMYFANSILRTSICS